MSDVHTDAISFEAGIAYLRLQEILVRYIILLVILLSCFISSFLHGSYAADFRVIGADQTRISLSLAADYSMPCVLISCNQMHFGLVSHP